MTRIVETTTHADGTTKVRTTRPAKVLAVQVTCETCGEETWSERYPCHNCDTCPPVSNWSSGFQFDQALRGMRLGKRVRRPGWDRSWGIEDGNLTIRWPDPGSGDDVVAEAFELHEDDIMADDWEVVS